MITESGVQAAMAGTTSKKQARRVGLPPLEIETSRGGFFISPLRRDGFFISPLRRKLSREEVKRVWQAAAK